MASWLVERRLTGVSQRLRSLREELRVIDEQQIYVSDEAEETRLRSLVGESPLADKEAREAARHAEALLARRAAVVQRIAELEQRQDHLLDRMNHRSKGRPS
jgi:chromosome segregation ATPase